jgi:hypothetical protein
MAGYDASSTERYSGPVELRVGLEQELDAQAIDWIEANVRAFLRAIEVGYFFPGTCRGSATDRLDAGGSSVHARLDVVDLATSAFAVLGGMLGACQHRDASVRVAQATLGGQSRDLLVDTGLRPEAVDGSPFAVEFAGDLSGNYALLVEIAFAAPVEPEVGERLLHELALWDLLALGYPIDPEDPAEVVVPQSHFNDPCTIHHHEWVWENLDPLAWNLLVNLCSAWNRTVPIVRLRVE